MTTTDGATPRALVADDQTDVLEALRLLLKGEGFTTRCARSPKEVAEAVQEETFDVLLMDLNYARDTTSGQEGFDLLDRVAQLAPDLPVVVMTAWGSVEVAVETMRRGARDFVEKPWDNSRLLSILRTQIELGRALRRGHVLEEENRLLRGGGDSRLIAASAAMEPVLELIARVGPSDANVLITGENGTGKGLVAQALHAASNRSAKPMVSVNAGALSEGVFESELFGHVKGAYTDAKRDRIGRFEMADQGILFLDEIANVSPALQAKLLRVLETGEFERLGSSRTRSVDVRVLSATNADLQTEVEEGRFRQDLLYRLNTIEIPLPPLRNRKEDILLLAEHFLEKHRQHYGRALEGFSEKAQAALSQHPWPGNVRELDHSVERGVLMASETLIEATDLGLGGRPSEAFPAFEDLTLEEVESILIQKALDRAQGNVKKAAESLGLSRSALYRRLQRYEL